MEFAYRDSWAVIHGLVLGVLFLLAFSGALAGLWSFRPGLITTRGIQERLKRLYVGLAAMAVAAWATVITGSWIVYPWYREKLAGDEYELCAGLVQPGADCSPRDFLKSNVSGDTEDWHNIGMEFKEHIGWAAPILATAAFLLLAYYGPRIVARPWLRAALLVMVVGAFGAAVVAGGFGAFITKIAPLS